MDEIRVNPTRMELKKLQARYTTARRGHKLLKDKRDELMKQFLDVVREDKALRERVETALSTFYRGFTVASASGIQRCWRKRSFAPKRKQALA
jgi:V/A-type H+-transporting ATPase subunit D